MQKESVREFLAIHSIQGWHKNGTFLGWRGREGAAAWLKLNAGAAVKHRPLTTPPGVIDLNVDCSKCAELCLLSANSLNDIWL